MATTLSFLSFFALAAAIAVLIVSSAKRAGSSLSLFWACLLLCLAGLSAYLPRLVPPFFPPTFTEPEEGIINGGPEPIGNSGFYSVRVSDNHFTKVYIAATNDKNIKPGDMVEVGEIQMPGQGGKLQVIARVTGNIPIRY